MIRTKFKVRKVKLDSGHYRLEREDGLTYTVRKGVKAGVWWVNNRPEKTTLRGIIFDMERGLTNEDWFRRKGLAEPELAPAAPLDFMLDLRYILYRRHP